MGQNARDILRDWVLNGCKYFSYDFERETGLCSLGLKMGTDTHSQYVYCTTKCKQRVKCTKY